MKKFAFALGVAIAAIWASLALSPTAQAYPDVQISLSSDHQVIYAGDSFTATAASNVDCVWEVDWNGDSRASSGTDFATKFTAPEVTSITKVPLTGVCSYDNAGGSGRSVSTAAKTWEDSRTITVLPKASGAAAPSENGASLANTGGPDRAVLLGGLGLLLSGATVAIVARRRAEHAELPGHTV
ncbi:hypothetical protein ABIE44_001986 [Marmoricola sp. OAE513]|uniref:hypothetical protein n=1 Tax=Marmoricola sp. OAE513 TaxID=2817894 RepID=UPI001AE6EEE9